MSHLDGIADLAISLKDNTVGLFLTFEHPEQAQAAFDLIQERGKTGRLDLSFATGPQVREH